MNSCRSKNISHLSVQIQYISTDHNAVNDNNAKPQTMQCNSTSTMLPPDLNSWKERNQRISLLRQRSYDSVHNNQFLHLKMAHFYVGRMSTPNAVLRLIGILLAKGSKDSSVTLFLNLLPVPPEETSASFKRLSSVSVTSSNALSCKFAKYQQDCSLFCYSMTKDAGSTFSGKLYEVKYADMQSRE